MKKVIAALLVLAIATPALAAIVTATQISGSEVKLAYDADGSVMVRAFGIDATLDSDANFVLCSDGNEAMETNGDYYIYPGSVSVDGAGNISDLGSPIGSPDDHPDTQPGIDSSGVTIEMGSLYASGDPAPGSTGDLLVLTVGSDCNIAMANNTARGGIVLEGGDPGSSYTGTKIWYSTLDRAEYVKWLAWGSGNPADAPQNWRGLCWKCGDVNNDGFVTAGDVIAVFGYLKDATSNGEGDANMDGFETAGDVIKVFGDLKSGNGCTLCP